MSSCTNDDKDFKQRRNLAQFVHGERKEWNRTKQVRARDTNRPDGDDRTGQYSLKLLVKYLQRIRWHAY